MRREPQRYPPIYIADAVRRAKVDSGLTWRRLAAQVGATHPHLVRIAHGTRVPGQWVAQRLIEVLHIDPEIAEELLLLAPHTSKHLVDGPIHRLHPDLLDTNGSPQWGDLRKLYRG